MPPPKNAKGRKWSPGHVELRQRPAEVPHHERGGAEKVRKLMVPVGQREASMVTPVNFSPSTRRLERIVIFVSFVAAELVLPFSTFFL